MTLYLVEIRLDRILGMFLGAITNGASLTMDTIQLSCKFLPDYFINEIDFLFAASAVKTILF